MIDYYPAVTTGNDNAAELLVGFVSVVLVLFRQRTKVGSEVNKVNLSVSSTSIQSS